MSIKSGAPKGFQKLPITTSAQPLTLPAGARCAIISVEGDAIRYRDDGTAPTATIGQLVYAGNVIEVENFEQLSQIQFIQADVAQSAPTITASYYYI